MIPAGSYRPNNYNYNYNSKPQPKRDVHFGSTHFSYLYKNSKRMNCYTNFFRGDLPWEKLGEIFTDTFKHKSKVQLINGACSDGSETVSLVMALKESLPKKLWSKFLPIRAFDFCEELIINAKRGEFEIDDVDIGKINKYIKNKETYLKDTYNPAQEFYIKPPAIRIIQAKQEVLSSIKFEQNDVFKVLEELQDDSNTIFMFRNALIHLGDNAAKKFATLAGKKLKKDSLIIVGSTDVSTTNIKKYLLEENFKEIAKNIYKKCDPPSTKKTIFKTIGDKIDKFFKKIFIDDEPEYWSN